MTQRMTRRTAKPGGRASLRDIKDLIERNALKYESGVVRGTIGSLKKHKACVIGLGSSGVAVHSAVGRRLVRCRNW